VSTSIKDIPAIELSSKKKTKYLYRVKPSECPIKEKYCLTKATTIGADKGSIEIKRCPFLVEKGLGNEEGYLVVKCSCAGNSLKFILEKED